MTPPDKEREALEQRVADLEAALEPFARLANTWTVGVALGLLTLSNGVRMCGIEADAFRRARAALTSPTKDGQ